MIAVGVANEDAAVRHNADVAAAKAYFKTTDPVVGVDLPGRDVVSCSVMA